MKPKLILKALTPDRALFNGEVDQVIVRTTEGEMAVLPGHDTFAAELKTGLMRIFHGGSEDVFMVLGGFITVSGDKVAVIAPLAEHPDKIEELLAGLEKERLAHQMDEERSELEINRAMKAIRNALVGTESTVYPAP